MMNNPDMVRQMMDNPFVQQMMSNPEVIRQLITSNPGMRDLMEVRGDNPGVMVHQAIRLDKLGVRISWR